MNKARKTKQNEKLNSVANQRFCVLSGQTVGEKEGELRRCCLYLEVEAAEADRVIVVLLPALPLLWGKQRRVRLDEGVCNTVIDPI